MEHKYTVTDLSVLTPWYTKFAVEPLLKFVPWWLPANIITLLSNFCVLIALVLTVLYTAGVFKFWLLVPLLIMAYVTGDSLDGKQARRTKTSSMLGEFLDHFLDIFTNGLLVSMTLLVYGITEPAFISLYLVISYITLSGNYFEQHKYRVMFFEKIGAFEAVIMIVIVLSLGFIETSRNFLLKDVFAHISVFDMMLMVITFGSLYTLKRSLDRSGNSVIKGFLIFFLLTVSTAFFAARILPGAAIMFVMTAYCGTFIGKLHIAYLLREDEPKADFIFPLFLGTAYLFKLPVSVTVPAAVIFQMLNIIITFTAGFMNFRKYWLWVNPGPEFVDIYTT
ncbi:MAG: CDP-alcohol phosphatidyltransferase family protein [Spirochaetales bacterium]|nr:CDP-alcohol phosphatidyltransferase family protein [Spirochaetales bacterium]